MAHQCFSSSSLQHRCRTGASVARPLPLHFSRFQTVRSRSLRLRVNAGPLVQNVTDNNFEEEVLKSSVPVLVDFWASWCGPCKLVSPTMDWAAKEYGPGLKVVKVDADPNPKLVEQYKVQGLPTLIIIKDGNKVEGSHWEGAITRKQLVEYLEKNHIVPVVNAA